MRSLRKKWENHYRRTPQRGSPKPIGGPLRQKKGSPNSGIPLLATGRSKLKIQVSARLSHRRDRASITLFETLDDEHSCSGEEICVGGGGKMSWFVLAGLGKGCEPLAGWGDLLTLRVGSAGCSLAC